MKPGIWFGFAALCLLSASYWLLQDFASGPLTGLLRQTVHSAVLALFFFAASFLKRTGAAPRLTPTPALILWSAVFFAVPSITLAAAGGSVPSYSQVLIFTLIPAATVFVLSQSSSRFGQQSDSLRLLMPALAGVGGTALVLPFRAPGATAAILWFAAVVCSAILLSIAGVRLHGLLRDQPILPATALICILSAVCSACFCWLHWTGLPAFSARDAAVEAAICLLFDAPTLLLTVWLLREMPPLTFAARFLLIPLVTLAEGYILMRPTLTWATFGGILLALGSAVLLLRQEPEA